MPLLVHPVAGALGVHRKPVKLAGKPDGEVADVDHLLYFAHALCTNFAHLQRDKSAELGFLFP